MGINIREVLGDEADSLLGHECKTIDRDQLTLPGPDFVDRVLVQSDRPVPVLRNLQQLFNHGRLGGTGYLSILPVDQGIEHSAAASFSKNPAYFDPQNLAELALAADCSAFASTMGVLGIIARRYAHKIPLIVKLNHNELLTYPNRGDQVPFASVQQAVDLGAMGVGATIYYGSEEATRQIREVSALFAEAHRQGLFTVLWCYLRNPAFKTARGRLCPCGRPHGTGEPPRGHNRGRHHQAEAAREQRRLHGAQVRSHGSPRLQPADDRPPSRPHPLAGRELLLGAYRADQLGWRVSRCERLRTGSSDGCDQQARRWHGADTGAQSIPAPVARRSRHHPRRSRRIPRQLRHGRVERTGQAGTGCQHTPVSGVGVFEPRPKPARHIA